jgi:hypothetical protein
MLINLFPDWSDEVFPLYVYHTSRHFVPAKVRAFLDFHALNESIAFFEISPLVDAAAMSTRQQRVATSIPGSRCPGSSHKT